MLFLVCRKDKPGGLPVRLANYQAHLDYLKSYPGKILVGGPTLGAGAGSEDQDMTGSFLIVEADGWEQVDAFVANDPFTKAALFATTLVERWKHGKHDDPDHAK
jgi:uncharacterized protein YciI